MANGMTSQELASKWSRNLLANKQSIQRGVESVTVSPTKKAADAVDRYADGCSRAASDGSFVRGCNSVSLEDWKSAFLDKGLKNLDNGVRMAETKMAKFLDAYMPYVKQVSAAVQNMPKGSKSDAMARMEYNYDRLKEFKGRGKR